MKNKSFVGKPIPLGDDYVYINPGTGPVKNASAGCARQNISQLIIDSGFDLKDVSVVRYPEGDENGRYSFTLQHDKNTCEVDMPGLDISEVRYMDSETQNIWDFPRLYVEGSSWVWKFAINQVRGQLLCLCEDEE